MTRPTTAMPHPSAPSDAAPDAFVMHLAGSQLPLRSFLHTLIRRAEDVDDVLQETNMVLWEKRGEYDGDRPFLPWACRFAHFQALAFLKRRQRADHMDLDDQLCQQIAAAATHHLEHMEARVSALRQCLRELPRGNRELVDLRYAEGVPVQRIAQNSGSSADAVSMRLYRVRKALGDCVRRALGRER